MKIVTFIIFMTFYTTPNICMEQTPTNKIQLSFCMKECCLLLNAFYQQKNYSLKDVRDLFVSISLVNKPLSKIAYNPNFIRATIKSIVRHNDHYTEETIAKALNTPSTRSYIALNNQWFNPQLTSAQDITSLTYKGADINYRRDNYSEGATPLIYFIYRKSLPMVQYLLKAKADINHYSDINPLSAAIRMLEMPIFELLIEQKNNQLDLSFPLRESINAYRNAKGSRLKRRKIRHISYSMIKYLIKKGADTTDGLVYMIEQSYFSPSLTYLFINNQADINIAFDAITKNILNATQTPKQSAYMIANIIAKMPNFNKVNNRQKLLQSKERINHLEAIINS